MNKLISMTLAAAMAVSFVGCGKTSEKGEESGEAKNLQTQEESGQAKEADSNGSVDLMADIVVEKISYETQLTKEQTVAATDFYARLFQQSFKEGENTLISPLSVWTALAMTANGAKGETLAQMEKVFGMSVQDMNSYLNTYVNQLPVGEGYEFSMANGIWFKEDEKFFVEQDFLQFNANCYGADAYKAPFDDTTLTEINQWVSDNTKGRVENILDKINKDAVMYLVNALTFDGEWQNIYTDIQVQDGVFTMEDQTEKKVKLMYSDEQQYLEDEQAVGFLKYYKDKKYAFAALLPNEGVSVSDFVSTLTGERLNQILTDIQETKVKAAIPVFDCEYEAEMSDILTAMGMTDAFDGDLADFTGIGAYMDGNLVINRVLHKTYIAVDEKGTEAGAASAAEVAVVMSLDIPEMNQYVYLDRPFLYMIIDCETNLPVFMGTVMEIGE